MHETAIRGARVLTPEGVVRADVALDAGRISRVRERVDEALLEVDGSGLLLLPGLLDARARLREPGAAEKEGLRRGTLAAAHGGVTTLLDVQDDAPLMVERAALMQKLELARGRALVNVGLFGNANQLSAGRLGPLADLVMGFSLSLAPTRSDPGVDSDVVLRSLFQEAARLGKVLAVHAEDRGAVRAGMRRHGAGGAAAWSRARPPAAEARACARAIRLAEMTGARIHLAPLSTAAAVDLVEEAKARDLPVTAGTCPHYLVFTDADVARLGARLKAEPAIKGEVDRERLRQGVREGTLDVIASDHCPQALAEKLLPFAACPAGISSLDVFLPVLLRLAREGVLTLETLLERACAAPACIFGVGVAARVRPGECADLVLVDERREWTPAEGEFASRARISPWTGMRLPARVATTWVGGKVVWPRAPGAPLQPDQ
ncbi:MAG: dihydroorotase family protein [Planctomycetes bacterium]|nr:dihydroorotase family protein [Planctomycetota bacterium]